MATTTTSGNSRQLRGDLDRLVRRARKVLDKAYLGARSRQVLCRTLALLFLFALPLLLVELVRYVAGYASFGLPAWQYAAVVVSGAGVFALGWLLRDFLRHVLPRGTTLGLFDRQLKLANRLATADEFIGVRERTGFMQAAIDDAVGPAQRAMGSAAQAIATDRRWPLSRGSLLSVPATVCLLLLTIWLGAQEQSSATGESFAGTLADIDASPDLSVVARLDEEAAREEDRRSGDDGAVEKTPGAEPGETADAGVPESFDSSASQPGGQPALLESQSEPSAGQPSGGLPSGAGSRPAGQAAGGQQTASGREAATGEQNPNRQAGSERQQAAGQQQADATESSGQQSANQSSDSAGSDSSAVGDQSADSGQESVAGNDSSAAPTDSAQSAQNASQQQAANQQAAQQASQSAGQPQGNESGRAQSRGRTDSEGAGGEQGGGEPDAQGQAQAQSQGQGGQPGQLQSGESRGEGRGDSNDAIKKNRGAAKALLAVPKPDRLIGVRGDGPEQIRQEQSVPQEQQAAPVAASARTERGDRIGTLQQTEVSGWSRQLVRNYFDRGGSATAGVPGETASDTPSTTTNTSEGQQP